ncbi:hypothetical protein BMF94_0788 [Rhodotorula taiwanensis]|uniref:Threonylcarbamoyl-AMP synthase n=1 Tax=Rhodotorula taiwanensis TaxID=741276 RepID=A0A2S5BH33_9BASI|nr:hypothetical protein BMF94_0788 [Rhodotorula taiwanensis]
MSTPQAETAPVASSSTMTAATAEAPLLPTDTEANLAGSLETASKLLHADLPVAFPTETVYGLGASALSSTAVKRIFAAKGRPSDNPLIVHVSSREMLHDLLPRNTATGQPAIPRMYEALMDRFWPGPLSLIFPLDPKGKGKAINQDDTPLPEPPRRAVAPEVTAGQPSLCVRMPSHPLAHRLIQHSNLPLAAPSANLSSRPSPTTAAHVLEDLGRGRGLGAVLDGGKCDVGVESSVVDWVAPPPGETGEGELRVLRAGGVSAEEIQDCLQAAGFGTSARGTGAAESEAASTPHRIQVYARDFRSEDLEERPTTPGMKYKHYAPGNAKVVLVKPVSGPASDGPLPSLQDLIQLTALTHTPVVVEDAESTDWAAAPAVKFRVGLMLTESTLSSLGASVLSSISSECTLVLLPPAPESPFANLGADEKSNLPDLDEIDVLSYSLGSRDRPLEAAQRLFAGLRFLDTYATAEDASRKVGVDLIFVEAVPEQGVGLAVMERARKAAGGQAGEMEFQL